MSTITSAIKTFIADENGVTAIEYGLIEIGRASCRERVL